MQCALLPACIGGTPLTLAPFWEVLLSYDTISPHCAQSELAAIDPHPHATGMKPA